MKVVALVAFMALLAIYAMSARQRSYDLDLPTKELFGQFINDHNLTMPPLELRFQLARIQQQCRQDARPQRASA